MIFSLPKRLLGIMFFAEDVASWWVEKCASSVQDCFIDGVGEVSLLTAAGGKQFAVDYGQLLNGIHCFSVPSLSHFCVYRIF